jgi:hypothetical protein
MHICLAFPWLPALPLPIRLLDYTFDFTLAIFILLRPSQLTSTTISSANVFTRLGYRKRRHPYSIHLLREYCA